MDIPLGKTTTLDVGLDDRDVQGVDGGDDNDEAVVKIIIIMCLIQYKWKSL